MGTSHDASSSTPALSVLSTAGASKTIELDASNRQLVRIMMQEMEQLGLVCVYAMCVRDVADSRAAGTLSGQSSVPPGLRSTLLPLRVHETPV